MNIDSPAEFKGKLDLKDLNVLSHAAPKRVEELQRGNLPTIAEDQVENDTIDFSKLGKKDHQRAPASRVQSRRNVARVPSGVRNGSQIASSRHHYQSEQRYDMPSARAQAPREARGSVERSYERPPINPRSADVYAHKNKVYYSQVHSRPSSDQEDASTSVSSRS